MIETVNCNCWIMTLMILRYLQMIAYTGMRLVRSGEERMYRTMKAFIVNLGAVILPLATPLKI